MVDKLRSKINGKDDSGFTLIELMIVVAIIGILAAIAIPNFTRFQLKSKSSEGKVNIAAIRTAEEAYSAEFGGYVSALPQPAAAAIGTTKDDTGVFTGTGWGDLGWAPTGPVYFSYEIKTSTGSGAYLVGAQANIDGIGANQSWGYKSHATAVDGETASGCAGNYARLNTQEVGVCADGAGSSVF